MLKKEQAAEKMHFPKHCKKSITKGKVPQVKTQKEIQQIAPWRNLKHNLKLSSLIMCYMDTISKINKLFSKALN